MKLTKEHKAMLRKFKRTGPWVQPRLYYNSITLTSPDGKDTTFTSARKAAEAIGVNSQCVSRVVRGESKTVKGWTFKSMQ